MSTTAADSIYNSAKALCYGIAGRAAGITSGFDITDRERAIIEAIAEWMGSRDCEIVSLKGQLCEAQTQIRELSARLEVSRAAVVGHVHSATSAKLELDR